MSKKYIVNEYEGSKYYKDVPYITKKEFKKNEDNIVVGKTRLKKYESDSSNDEVDLLYFKENKYEVKDRIFGFKKGYVHVGDNNYILIKKRIPFLIILFLLLLLIVLFVYSNINNNLPDDKPINNSSEEKVVPDKDKNSTEESKKDKEDKKDDPYKYVPKRDKVEEAQGIKYTIVFDSNGGEGTLESITCDGNEVCNLPKNTFTKEGYNFTGWSTEINGEPIYLDEMEVFNLTTENNAKVVLYAMWYIESFGVEFINYDGSTIYKAEYDYGDNVIIPEEPERKGYTFIGWDKDVKEVTEDLTITALYNINNYEFSYNLDGGAFEEDAPSTYTIEDESFKIPVPNKKGYTFIGWTEDEKDTPNKDYEIKQGTIGNIELTANYEANSYKLIYNTNGATKKLEPKIIKFDEEFGEIPTVSKNGYDFINWTNTAKEEISSSTIFNETNDITIDANWDTITYDITYNLIGGSIIDAPNSYNIENESIKIPNPEKEGYIFIGWTTEKNNTPIIDYEISHGSIGNVELTANYKPISYYISYNPSGGEGIMENMKIKYNNSAKLSKNIFTKEGYNFVGWAIEENGDVIFEEEQEIYNLSNKNNSVITLYAKWEIIKLNVKYYDLFGVILKEETVNYGNKSIPPKDPFIDGYTFTGWSPSNEVIKSNMVYQAQYNLNNYVINYDLNTGTSSDMTEIEYTVESPTITLPTPTRIGYTFKGWAGSNGLRPEIEISILKGTIGNKSYKANWEANMYNVSLNPNNGSIDTDYIVVPYNSLYGIIPEPTRIGYTFKGWYYHNSLIDDNSVMRNDFDHELLADWEVIDYNITYEVNGGSMASQISKYNIESPTFTLPTPTKTGYVFKGWTGSNGNIPQTNVSITKGSTGDKSYKANWETVNYSISYNLNGGSSSSLQTSYNIESPTFTLPTPTRTGYTFKGWTGSNGNTPQTSVSIAKGSTGNKSYNANWEVINYSIAYDLNGGLSSPLQTSYNIESSTLTLPTPTKTGYIFKGWTESNGNTPQTNISIAKGSTGNKSYKANWEKYSAVSYNGIYLVSTRDNVTWAYTLDGYYEVGDTDVYSGNWKVTVDDYCVHITGTTFPGNAYTYQFYVYQANSINNLLATGNASVPGNYLANAKATICW